MRMSSIHYKLRFRDLSGLFRGSEILLPVQAGSWIRRNIPDDFLQELEGLVLGVSGGQDTDQWTLSWATCLKTWV